MDTSRKEKIVKWFKRLGFAGFMFFLIKGLLWLIIPYLIAKGLF
jgi:hypothetical protein